jgi:hypothetical protein
MGLSILDGASRREIKGGVNRAGAFSFMSHSLFILSSFLFIFIFIIYSLSFSLSGFSLRSEPPVRA